MYASEPMKRLSVLILLCLFLLPVAAQDATETSLPPILRPVPSSNQTNGTLSLNRYFASLVQGQVGLLQLMGENIQEARVLFRSREYPFSNSNNDGWYAF